MARRRMTVKRIDPWSVLKFGFLVNIVLLIIFLMVMAVVWFIVDRLQLVDQVCGIAADVGFTQCGINAGNLFRSLILLGLLWVVIQTAVLVFFSFLYNLISDLTGGLGLTIVDDTAPSAATAPARQVATAGHQPGAARTATGWTSTGARSSTSATDGSGTQTAVRQEAPARQDATPRQDATERHEPVASTDPGGRAVTRARATASDDELFGDR